MEPVSKKAESASSTIYVSGLRDSVEILVDQWGIPHIYASSRDDLFFAQGFNAARDRLWQLDFWRRRGLGLLSEVFGPDYAEHDRAARLFLYRGDMDQEWAAYGPNANTKQTVAAFTAGINAFIELTERRPEYLPELFKTLGYRPARWEPEDVVRIRSHGLHRNLKKEVARAVTLRKYGAEAEQIRQRLEPEWTLTVPEGLDLEDITEEILHVYNLATEPIVFGGAGKADDGSPSSAIETASPLKALNQKIEDESNLGSNNWVIGPEKSVTGRPILANDPHRALSTPSLRYIVHLCAPDLNVIGGGEPVLPGVSIGHNGKAAFGLTIFSIDQEDLYVYEINPDNPDQYKYKGQWETIRKVTETIAVKGEQPRQVELEFTCHGPVICRNAERNRAYAVRAAWLEPGMAPYLGSLSYMGVQNWQQFTEAMNNWGAPSENQVYADTDGNIGWKPGGLAPVRPNWDGLLPVPGNGDYEWDGFMDQSKLPFAYNPEQGWIATANEMNLPEGFAYEKYKLGFEWALPFRYERIAEAIRQHGKLDIDTCVAIQNDYTSMPARRILKLLAPLSSDDPQVSQALALLKQWDGRLDKDSAAAALFEVWYAKHLNKAIAARVLGDEAVNEAEPGDLLVLLGLLEKPDSRFGEEPETARDQLLLASLKQAVLQMEDLLGKDMGNWQWGNLHYAYFTHPMSPLVDPAALEQLNIGPFRRGGSADTPGNTTYERGATSGKIRVIENGAAAIRESADGKLPDFRQTFGATFRVVIDVGEWDRSVVINSPGQSGNPESKHYADLALVWADDRAVPMLYSRDKIEEVTEERILLLPRS